MKVSDFIDELCLGPLSNLSIGERGLSRFTKKDEDRVLSAINQTLDELCARFPLVHKELVLITRAHISKYHLTSKHSMRKDTGPLKYIDDRGCEPFCDDLIRVLEVVNSGGRKYPLREPGKADNIDTPVYNELQILRPREGEPLNVIYQAMHPKVKDCADSVLLIPPHMKNALLAGTAARIFSPMTGELHKLSAQEHRQTFDSICLEAEAKDTISVSEEPEDSCKFTERGFI